MLLTTCYFIHISNELFETDDFSTEKDYFKIALTVFLTTYIFRTLFLITVLSLFTTYKDMWQNYPQWTALLETILHVLYDVFPVMIIMGQHHRTF